MTINSNNYDEVEIDIYLGIKVTIIDSLLQRVHPYNLLQKFNSNVIIDFIWTK